MTRTVFFALAVLVMCTGVAHTLAYHDEVALEQEAKRMRALRQANPHPARIWSKKCEQRGLRVLATQADGGKWIVRCVSGKGQTKA